MVGRPPSTEQIRVLAVDDDPGIVELTELYLERNDSMTVETVTSGRDGLDRLRATHFDCIVSDYKMPGMDGLEFLDSIRNDVDSPVPFIIFTGNSREEVAIEALNLGANRYLQKGGDPTAQFGLLADAIQQEVDHSRATVLARKYEERLTLAQEIANFGIIDWNLTTNEVDCSDELCEMFGLPTDEPLTISDIEAVMHPDDKERIQAALNSAIAGESRYHLSHRIKRPDGEVIWTKNQATLVRGANGEPLRLVGIAVDVTAERQAEPLKND